MPAATPDQIVDAFTGRWVSRVLTAADLAYAGELAGFNLGIVHSPDVVVAAETTTDVAAAVTVAADLGIPVTAIGRGHGFVEPITAGIAVTTTRLASVEIDAEARTARVGAGTAWNAVVDAAAEAGLAALCGSAPGVGVVGYILGGGLGPLARTYGFTADHVRSLDLVTLDGREVTASADENPDLFWALRGGGKTGFGVVTALTMDLVPLSRLYGGGLFFAAQDARTVLHAFAEWSVDLPEEVTTSVALLRLPPLPEVPEPLRGQFVVHVRIAYVGEAADGERLVAPLRAAATPLLDAVAEMPYAAVASIHADPTTPMPVTDGGLLLERFDAEAVEALLAAAGPEQHVPLAAVEVRVLGGAVARQSEPPSAVTGRDASHSLFVVGAPLPPQAGVDGVVRGVLDALTPFSTGTSQPNLAGKANEPHHLAGAWDEETAARLAEVRRRYGAVAGGRGGGLTA